MYRYRYNNGGTVRTLKRVRHYFGYPHALDTWGKLGELLYVKGYRYVGRYGATHEAVMIKGTKGSMRFGGFCWGYGGEGPRGLVDLLMSVGFTETSARSVAFDTIRKDEVGVDWIAHKIPSGWSIKHDVKAPR